MTAYSKKLFIFDMGGTLTHSRTPMNASLANLIVKLMETKKVAVISGGGYPQFMTQFLHSLPESLASYSNLILLPASGTRMYAWKGSWSEQYAEHLTPPEKQQILSALNLSLKGVGYVFPSKAYGEIIEDRGSQITFSALGQNAPIELKEKWDPDASKRKQIVTAISQKLQGYEIRIGGLTSIDITRRGANKSYGIRKLESITGISLDQMVYIGNSLDREGNDFPAKATGIDCISVSGPEETEKLIAQWIG